MTSIKSKPSKSIKSSKSIKYSILREISQLSLQPKRHFNFDNGDEYEGEFAVNLETRKVVRHGFGIYTTISCVRFEGQWLNDRLVDVVKIQYPNGHCFEGKMDEQLNAMIGTLFLVDGGKFIGEFSRQLVNDEIVYGKLDFFDRNERQWNVTIQDDVIHLTRERFI